MTRKARVRVSGRIDNASTATITIDATAGLISVRPFRRRREYTLPLEAVAKYIIFKVVTAELGEKKRAKKRAKRGLL